jgi:hypothetical protein
MLAAHAQGDFGLGHRLYGGIGVASRGRERLLDQDVFSGRRTLHRLPRMHMIRRAEPDGVYLGISEQLFK